MRIISNFPQYVRIIQNFGTNFLSVKYECGRITNQMTSYFQNPGWPEASQDRIVCTLTVELQPDVLQVLIEFLLFEVCFCKWSLASLIFSRKKKYFQLKAPTDGKCIDDQFIIAGQNLNNQIPTICGVNTGQHSKFLWLSCLIKPAAGGWNKLNFCSRTLKSSYIVFINNEINQLATFSLIFVSNYVNSQEKLSTSISIVFSVRRSW